MKFQCNLSLKKFNDQKLMDLLRDIELSFIPTEGMMIRIGKKIVRVSSILYDMNQDSWKLWFDAEYISGSNIEEWLAEGFYEETP